MTRRLAPATASLLLTVLAAAVAPPASAREGPPDVVLVVTDDQRWDTLWAMPVVRARIAGLGVEFPEAFVVNPLCCPSRASILTGRYSHSTLVYRQIPPFGRFEWFRDGSTIATWLDGAGYTTGLFGKYLDGYQHAALTGYVPPGWDRWAAFVRAGYEDYALSVDGQVRRFGGAPEDYSTDVLASSAVAFIEEADGPLFLTFAPAAPHAPAVAATGDADAFADLNPARPPSFGEADIDDKPAWVRALAPLTLERVAAIDAFRRQQLRSLLAVDRAIGRILDALERAGRLENTLVILTSDNGILHGEHRWTRKEAPYEEAIRVPLVMRWDAASWAVPLRLDDGLALNVDLAPTIAEAAGVAAPGAEGRSLLPLVRDPSSDWREDFLIEHLEGENPVPTYCAVRSAGWKYIRYATGEEELYDLRADPFELANLAADPTRRALLDERRARLRELCVPPPPGFEGPAPWRLPVALASLVVLLAVEAVRARRLPGRPGGRR